MSEQLQLKRALLRHPGLARLAVVVGAVRCCGRSRRAGWIDPTFLSPPSRVLASLGDLFDTKGIPAALRITFWELAVAFAISVVIGLVVGLAVGLSRFSNRSLMPIILLLYGTPQITILPLFILYFGIGPPSKIAFGVSHGIFPIIVTIVAGVQNIKPILMTAAHSMGASRWQIFRWVIFPHMIPTLLCRDAARHDRRAARRAAGRALRLDRRHRLFHHSCSPRRSSRPSCWASISVLAAMAIVLNEIVRRAEVHFGRWRTD